MGSIQNRQQQAEMYRQVCKCTTSSRARTAGGRLCGHSLPVHNKRHNHTGKVSATQSTKKRNTEHMHVRGRKETSVRVRKCKQ